MTWRLVTKWLQKELNSSSKVCNGFLNCRSISWQVIIAWGEVVESKFSSPKQTRIPFKAGNAYFNSSLCLLGNPSGRVTLDLGDKRYSLLFPAPAKLHCNSHFSFSFRYFCLSTFGIAEEKSFEMKAISRHYMQTANFQN